MLSPNTDYTDIPDVIIKKSLSIWLKEAGSSFQSYKKFWSKAPIYLFYESGKTGILLMNNFESPHLSPTILCECIYDNISCVSISDFQCLLALYKNNKCGLLCLEITDHQNITIQSKVAVPCLYDTLKPADSSEDTPIFFFDKHGVKYYNPITDMLSPYYNHIMPLQRVISAPNSLPFLHCICENNAEIILDSFDDNILLNCKGNHSYKYIGCCRNGVLVCEEMVPFSPLCSLYFFYGYEEISRCYKIGDISKYRLSITCMPDTHSSRHGINLTSIAYRKTDRWIYISIHKNGDLPINLLETLCESYPIPYKLC